MILFLVLIGVVCSAITQLHPRTLHKFLQDNTYTLLYIYSPSCSHCREFTPLFESLPQHTDVGLAKMDGLPYEQFRSKYSVDGFPALMFFRNHLPLPIFFRKERTVTSIVQFIDSHKKSSEGRVKEGSHQKIAYFYGVVGSREYYLMQILVARDEYMVWEAIQSKQTYIKAIFGGVQTIIPIKMDSVQDMFSVENALKKAYARLNDLTMQSWLRMVERKQQTIVYFNKNLNATVESIMRAIALKHYKINVFQIHGTNDQYKEALKQVGVKNKELIVSVQRAYQAVYVLENDFTYDNIRYFIFQAHNHSWPLYRKSQESERPSKITRDSFEVKLNVRKDIVLFLYKKTDKSSKDVMGLFKYVKGKLGRNEKIEVLRCDVGENQIQEKLSFAVENTPMVVYYRNNMKEYPIHFTGTVLNSRTLMQFIEQNTTVDLQEQL